MSDELKIASAEEWGASTIEEFHANVLLKKLFCALPLPSGRTILVTRPPLAQWYSFGQLPESLSSLALKSVGHKPAEIDQVTVANELMKDPTQIRGLAQFVRQILEYAVVSPRVKEFASGQGEIHPSKIPPQDLQFILEWVQGGCKGVPIETTKGVVSDESLDNFRIVAQSQSTPGDGDNVQDVRTVS